MTMEAVAETSTVTLRRATPEQRRAKAVGILLVVLGAFVLWVFGLGVDGGDVSTFNLSLPGARYQGLKWAVDSRGLSIVIAAIIAFLGGLVLRRTHLRWTNVALAISLALTAMAFLTWAAAGQSFSLVGMLVSTVVLSVPVTLGALSGLMCERVAVINIAIEGQLLTSAFVGTIVGSASNIWIGLISAVLTGAVLGAVLAVLAIRYHIDQIIAGVVINIFALGLTSFLARRVLSAEPGLNSPGRFSSVKIPLLGDIPVIGPMFFDQNMFVYATFVFVIAIHFALFYTRWGLRSRSVGEHPKAADTVGIDVFKTRYRNVIMGGCIAGFGAGLVFGFARALQQKLGILGTPIPSEFLSMLPYIVTIIVVAGVVGRSRPPAADGQAYIKQ